MAQQHSKILWPISNSQSGCSCLPRRNTTLGQATYGNLSRSLPQPLFLFKERHWFAVPSPRWRCCHSKSMPGSGLSSAGRWTFLWFETLVHVCDLHLCSSALVLSPNPALVGERGFSHDRCLLHPHLMKLGSFWYLCRHSWDHLSFIWSLISRECEILGGGLLTL